MNSPFFLKWFYWTLLTCVIIFNSACSVEEAKSNIPSKNISEKIEFPIDTIRVTSSEELIKNIRSNRIIQLVNNDYILNSTLMINDINHLKIIGLDSSRLMIEEKNATVINVLNSRNFSLENLFIGDSKSQGHEGEQGTVRIQYSEDININNCKIMGAGTFGFVTNDVNHLSFTDSEITDCTILIFELEKSQNAIFKNVKFHNNNLAASVLGGFTNNTKDVSFINCQFLNNTPELIRNPAFNFFENDDNLNEKIIFKNCVFKNNKDYKWYGDKIELINCEIDSSDFIGLGTTE